MKRAVTFIIIVLIALFVGTWYIKNKGSNIASEPEKFMRGDEEWVKYDNPSLGLKFEYRKNPDGYTVIDQDEKQIPLPTAREFLTIVNTRELEEVNNATTTREGPPTISILVADNPTATTSRGWAESNKSVSGIDRALTNIIDGEFSGAPAIRYIADGLYGNDTFVVATGTKVYVIVGSFMDENSQIRRDFLNMLQYFSLY